MEALGENIGILLGQPVTLAFLAGVFGLISGAFYMRKVRLTTHTIIIIALMLAFTILLNEVRLYHFPQGGSVTLGSMVPLLLLTHSFGARVGVLAGFLYGLILILQDPFILHPIQVLFDYPLPYMVVGLAAFFPRHMMVSVIAVFIGKFLCHFISGVVFFSSYAPDGMPAALYSLIVNLSMAVPECVICCVILKFLPVNRLIAAMSEMGHIR